MALRAIWVSCVLSALAVIALPLPAPAECQAPCGTYLCHGGATAVLVGTPIATGTIRVDELWGAPTTTVRVGDQLGPSPLLTVGQGERVYLVFDANDGPYFGFEPLVVNADGDVACPLEGPLALAEAVAITTSSDCPAAATRAGLGDKPCNDVITETTICSAGGSGGDALAAGVGVGLLALAALRGNRRR